MPQLSAREQLITNRLQTLLDKRGFLYSAQLRTLRKIFGPKSSLYVAAVKRTANYRRTQDQNYRRLVGRRPI